MLGRKSDQIRCCDCIEEWPEIESERESERQRKSELLRIKHEYGAIVKQRVVTKRWWICIVYALHVLDRFDCNGESSRSALWLLCLLPPPPLPDGPAPPPPPLLVAAAAPPTLAEASRLPTPPEAASRRAMFVLRSRAAPLRKSSRPPMSSVGDVVVVVCVYGQSFGVVCMCLNDEYSRQ